MTAPDESQMAHCRDCAHRLGSGCGCECCPWAGDAVAEAAQAIGAYRDWAGTAGATDEALAREAVQAALPVVRAAALCGEADRVQRLADGYAKRIRAAEHEAERLRVSLTAAEQATEELARQFPPCPACGCRAPDEPDQRECGCDMGCNDGPHAPGINVLLAELAAELKASRADADLVRDEKSEGDRALMAVVAERDRLREQLAAHEASQKAEAEMAVPSPGERCFDCATDDELAAAIPPYPAPGAATLRQPAPGGDA